MSKKPSGYEKTLEIIKSTRDMPAGEAIRTLSECVKKGFSLASQRAIKIMAELNHPTLVPSLLELYDWVEENSRKRDDGCNVRIAITEALGDSGSTAAIETIRKAARTVHVTKIGPLPEDTATGLRATAAIALAKTDSDALFELSLLLFDRTPGIPSIDGAACVRKAAAQAMSILGDSGAAPLLAVKLKFPDGEDSDVIAECIESLTIMRPPFLMEIVKPYLLGNDDYYSAIAALALAENFGSEVLDLLSEAFDNTMGEAKEAIVIAISATRCEKARQMLLEMLDSNNHFVRRGAVKGLKTYLDDETEERLKIISTTDPNESVRTEAERA